MCLRPKVKKVFAATDCVAVLQQMLLLLLHGARLSLKCTSVSQLELDCFRKQWRRVCVFQ